MYRILYKDVAGHRLYRAQYLKWNIFWKDIENTYYTISEEADFAIAQHRNRKGKWKIWLRRDS